MLKHEFNLEMDNVESITNRKYNGEAREAIYDRVNHIPNSSFKDVLSDYLDEVPPPMNLAGYVRRNYSKPIDSFADFGEPYQEYTKEQASLYLRAIKLMAEKRGTNEFDHDTHRSAIDALNNGWGGNAGDKLDEFLKGFLGTLTGGTAMEPNIHI